MGIRFDPTPLLTNPRWKTTFTIRRYTRAMVKGRAVDSFNDTDVVGVIVPNGSLGMSRTNDREQQGSGILIFSLVELRTGVGETNEPADDVIWHGQLYQLTACDDYSDFNFWVANGALQEPGGRAVA